MIPPRAFKLLKSASEAIKWATGASFSLRSSGFYTLVGKGLFTHQHTHKPPAERHRVTFAPLRKISVRRKKRLGGNQVIFTRLWPETRMARKEALAFYAFISPWLIGFLAFTFYPMLAQPTTASDIMAIGALKGLREAGLRVPQ